jgi:hypothetical protein
MSKNTKLNSHNLETSRYFSALETPDGVVSKNYDENDYSVEENYYTPLIQNQMNSIDEYYSLYI